ncbi:conserved membrane protein of unknown function [Rhodovastum atsumiense]|uniref:DUF2029 domain-containing protein n=1 Tax=Rhodovastum atsumiense TaxID=504468 RepID=A0A5M6J237_9PROT|nr:hypothetical protein [Rhodovastum atsumiense]KAA5614660.1 hypothetical protein F1189_00600 [Rhodovastum atsumiense]CAH2599810.1 conserved membrane protein of unknown function [Rhodovastum atsumiense]
MTPSPDHTASHGPGTAVVLARRIALFALVAVALSPFYFVIFRLMAFGTVPRDDYAPFLLALLGEPGGAMPESPYGYRLLSVLVAAPFYYLLPSLPLTNLPPDLPLPSLRATEALAFVSYLAMILAGFVAFATARTREGLPPATAALAGLLLFVLCWYSQFFALDPLAILVIALLLWLLPRPGWFAAVMLLAPLTNEKIIIVFAVWLSLRCIVSASERQRLGRAWLATLLAGGLYLAMVMLVHLPGNEYQLDTAGYFATIRTNLAAWASGRGLVLNVLPLLVLAGLALLGHRFPGAPGHRRRIVAADLMVIPALVVVALVLTQFFQVGRIVMHAAPLFVGPAATVIAARLGSAREPEAGAAFGLARSSGTAPL